MDGDENEVATGRRDKGRAEHVAGQVVVVGDFEGEHRAGGGGFEDGGDPGRGAGDEQRSALWCGEQSGVSVLQRVAEGRTQVERRAFQPHGHAAAEGRHRRDHPPCQMP